MSPKNHKERKDIQNSTTEFFLKVIQKQKSQAPKDKENSTKENISYTKTKTMQTIGRFYNYINQTLDKILASKVSIMLLSFLMAGILFYSVSGGENMSSLTSGTTLENVPIIVEGLAPTLEVSGVPETATISLIGPSLDIYQVNFTKNYQVYLDLNGLQEGEHNVHLKTRNFPDTLTVMLLPDSLNIKLSPKVDQTFDLGYRFINEDQMDSQYSVSVEEIATKSVIVHASHETLARIDRVEACIDVANQTEGFEQDAKIQAFDSGGNVIEIEDISPKTVHVKCNVSSYSKKVNVKANFIGEMPEGYQISNYALSQSQITIYGLEKEIKDIDVVTVDIDVSELKSRTTFNEVAFSKENGINKFSSDSVDVTVDVEKVVTKKFEKIPIKVLNNSNKYKVSFAGEGGYATVSVTGGERKVDSLTADNIQASIDIDKMKVGTRKVDVKIAIDDDSLVIQLLSSKNVTINIERN